MVRNRHDSHKLRISSQPKEISCIHIQIGVFCRPFQGLKRRARLFDGEFWRRSVGTVEFLPAGRSLSLWVSAKPAVLCVCMHSHPSSAN